MYHLFFTAAEQSPPVARVEEVMTSSEEHAPVSDYEHVTDDTKQSDIDKAHSDGSSAFPLSQQNSALRADSSVNNDSTATVSCSEPQSSDASTTGASSTPLSATSDPPDVVADDDNPEITLLVVTAVDV